MTAHKNIPGTYHLSVADILQVVYQVCFSPSVEINQDGVAARTSLMAKSRFQKHS